MFFKIGFPPSDFEIFETDKILLSFFLTCSVNFITLEDATLIFGFGDFLFSICSFLRRSRS